MAGGGQPSSQRASSSSAFVSPQTPTSQRLALHLRSVRTRARPRSRRSPLLSPRRRHPLQPGSADAGQREASSFLFMPASHDWQQRSYSSDELPGSPASPVDLTERADEVRRFSLACLPLSRSCPSAHSGLCQPRATLLRVHHRHLKTIPLTTRLPWLDHRPSSPFLPRPRARRRPVSTRDRSPTALPPSERLLLVPSPSPASPPPCSRPRPPRRTSHRTSIISRPTRTSSPPQLPLCFPPRHLFHSHPTLQTVEPRQRPPSRRPSPRSGDPTSTRPCQALPFGATPVWILQNWTWPS